MAAGDLRRFWLELEPVADHALPFGFGVTAVDIEDALGLIARTFEVDAPLVPRRVVADVDVGDLADELERVVRPLRLGVPIGRGIWYPNLVGP